MSGNNSHDYGYEYEATDSHNYSYDDGYEGSEYVSWCHSYSNFQKLWFGFLVVVTVIIIFGIIGNLLCAVTLHFRYDKTVTNFLLKTLALWFESYLVLSLVYISLDWFSLQHHWYYWKIMNAQHHLVPFMLLLELISIWHLVLTGLYQFLCIYKPVWIERHCTIRRVYVILLITVLICTFLQVPTFILVDKMKNTRHAFTYQGVIYNSAFYGHRYYVYFLFGCMYFFIPVAQLFIYCFGLIRATYKAQRNQNMRVIHRELKDATKSIVGICIVFVLTYSPYMIGIIDSWKLENFHKQFTDSVIFDFRNCTAYVMFVIIFAVLPFINASSSCIIYVFMRKSFRQKVKYMLLCKKEPESTDDISLSDAGHVNTEVII